MLIAWLVVLIDQDADDRKAKIDHHKHDQLNKQKEGKGHWKRELGSNSESAVCIIRLKGFAAIGLGSRMGWDAARLFVATYIEEWDC